MTDFSAKLVTVELDARELLTLVTLAKGRMLELERMMQNLEEGEGMDLERHNALKTMRPQVEAFNDLILKLEGARHELESGRRSG